MLGLETFDSVDRNLLLFKFSNIGITCHMYFAIFSLYFNPKSRVILQDYSTEYFDCPVGVKQGDCLSPTLFAIYINDLAKEIKNSGVGVELNIDENDNNIDSTLLNIYSMPMMLYCSPRMSLTFSFFKYC